MKGKNKEQNRKQNKNQTRITERIYRDNTQGLYHGKDKHVWQTLKF